MAAGIDINRDPEARGIHEPCCFCWKPTPWWTNLPRRKPGEQVACCPGCAETYRVKDVPSKVYWCETVKRFHQARRNAYMEGRQDMNRDHWARQNPKVQRCEYAG